MFCPTFKDSLYSKDTLHTILGSSASRVRPHYASRQIGSRIQIGEAVRFELVIAWRRVGVGPTGSSKSLTEP